MKDREEVRSLIAAGANNCEIARHTGVPLTTVRNWRVQPPVMDPCCLCPLCGNAVIPPEPYGYLLGLYLGDGHIVEVPRQVFRLSIYLDAIYPGIVEEASQAMAFVRPEGAIGSRRRGLIHSDGCRSMNRVRVRGVGYEYPRYQFTNLSPDIRAIFCLACEDFGVRWTQSNAVTISVSRSDDVTRLDSVVGRKR
jgi:hypothetical protein